MANGGDKAHHDEKKVDRKESQQPKTGTADGLKAKSVSNQAR
jgi:hypothetical protein